MLSRVYLEITNCCNLACAFCPPTVRRQTFLQEDDFRRYLEAIRGTTRHLYFHLKGEPLLHPRLGDFLEMAASQGFQVTLTTNGTLLFRWTAALLSARNLQQLNISLHSQGGEDSLETYFSGIWDFLEARRGRGEFPVSLRLWNRKDGVLPEEGRTLWRHIQVRYPALGSPEDPGRRSGTLEPGVFLNMAEEFLWPDLGREQKNARGRCHGLGNQAGVLVDGTVVPCCLDGEGAVPLGNLRESTLADILESSRARRIREGFSRGVLEEALCRTCGFRERFR